MKCLHAHYAWHLAGGDDPVGRWVAARVPPAGEADRQPVSLDGKTLRGSRDGEAPGQHLVAAYAHEHRAVLAQVKVDAKTNEHKAALQLLGILPVKGRVVLGDALFCQRDLCAEVIARGGDYLFTVKGNQMGLEKDIAAGFGFETVKSPQHSVAVKVVDKDAGAPVEEGRPARGCGLPQCDRHEGEGKSRDAYRRFEFHDNVHGHGASGRIVFN